MAFLKLSSTNPNFSYVIEKNPSSPMIIKKNLSGFLFGWYNSTEQGKETYCIHFKDGYSLPSYRKHQDDKGEYLNTSQYDNPRFVCDAISNLLHSARENKHSYLENGQDYDQPFFHSIEISSFRTHEKTLDIFKKYFTNFSIRTLSLKDKINGLNIPDVFTVHINNLTPITLSEFLKVINILGIFGALNSKDYIYIEDGLAAKYLRLAGEVNAPYFIRYLMKLNFLRSERRFKELKPLLESNTNGESYNFVEGDTHEARINFIKSHVTQPLTIIDIGSGKDYRYIKAFTNFILKNNIKYYSIERDEEALEEIKHGIRKRELENNVEVFPSLTKFLKEKRIKEKCYVICSEVLEHNELNESKGLVKEIIDSNLNFEKIVITVPNKEFNKNYAMTSEFRHYDHKWELSFEDFVKEFQPVVEQAKSSSTSFIGIGDSVNNVNVSTALILEYANI